MIVFFKETILIKIDVHRIRRNLLECVEYVAILI